MLNVSVITQEVSQDFEHALDWAASWGLRGVEIRELWGKNVIDLDGAERRPSLAA